MSDDGHLVELPAASPALYLRWIAFWREVEERMLASEQLQALAEADAAPFIHGSVAEFISGAARAITTAAMSAHDQPSVSPSLAIPAGMRTEVADTIARRSAWLDLNASAIGIEPLEPELRDLRERVVASLRIAAG